MDKMITEQSVRERCRVACAECPDLPRIKTISAVGAYDAVIGTSDIDSLRLTAAIDYLLQSGFIIDPEFEIDVVNFREGRDFLKEESKADLVFVSYILKDRYYADIFDSAASREGKDELSFCTMVSWRNTDAGWCDRIDGAEAKLVVTYGGNIEVGTGIFSLIGYKALIPTPDAECASDYTERPQEIRKLYPQFKDIDLPIGWLGFSADPAYLREIAPALNEKTCLGRRALNPDEVLPEIQTRKEARYSGSAWPDSSKPKKIRQATLPLYRRLKSSRTYNPD